MKNIIRYTLLLVVFGYFINVNAKPVIKASFCENTDCGTDVLSLDIVLLRSNNSDVDFNIGHSSIFINYNKEKLTFDSYVPHSDFDYNCIDGNDSNCYDYSTTNGTENGFFNLIVGDLSNSTTFVSGVQFSIGRICFNINSGATIEQNDIYFNQYFTSFNNATPNNGTGQIAIEFDNNLSCPVICEGLFSGTIGYSLPNASGYTTLTLSLLATLEMDFTYLWEDGNTNPYNTNECVYESNYVDVTETNSGCTIRIDYSPSSSGNCSFVGPTIPTGGTRGNTVILTPILNADNNGGLIPAGGTFSGNIQIFGPPKLGNFEEGEITIQPNPTNGLFSINFKKSDIEEAILKIYSLAGQLVKEQQVSPNENTTIVDAKKLSNGMYLIKIETNRREQIFLEKITIAH